MRPLLATIDLAAIQHNYALAQRCAPGRQAFAVVKAALPLAATFPYVLAAIAGSASSLVPGGLGVSEALGALMARAVQASPESAFLALAVNRVTQFLGTAILAPLLELRSIRSSLPESR